MYSEDELLPISALQHLLFCERQCALIHIGSKCEHCSLIEICLPKKMVPGRTVARYLASISNLRYEISNREE